jgi:hypothetical protein
MGSHRKGFLKLSCLSPLKMLTSPLFEETLGGFLSLPFFAPFLEDMGVLMIFIWKPHCCFGLCPQGPSPTDRGMTAHRHLLARFKAKQGTPSPFPHGLFTGRFQSADGRWPMGRWSRSKLSLRELNGGWWGSEVLTVAAYRRCEVLPTGPSSCTCMRWTCGSCQAKPPATSGTKVSSHRRMTTLSSIMEAGEDGLELHKLGQKDQQVLGFF